MAGKVTLCLTSEDACLQSLCKSYNILIIKELAMETIVITPNIKAVVADLARQLNITGTDVIRRAVHDYAEKIRKKRRLMSFAGTLDETEADNLLRNILNSRLNKNWEPCL